MSVSRLSAILRPARTPLWSSTRRTRIISMAVVSGPDPTPRIDPAADYTGRPEADAPPPPKVGGIRRGVHPAGKVKKHFMKEGLCRLETRGTYRLCEPSPIRTTPPR